MPLEKLLDSQVKLTVVFFCTQSLTTGMVNFREVYPERFPLADIKAMAFCRAATFHSRLAVATHAGIVFLLTV